MGETYWPNPADLTFITFTHNAPCAQTFTPLWSHTIHQIRHHFLVSFTGITIKIALQYIGPDGTPTGTDLASLLVYAVELKPHGWFNLIQRPFPAWYLVKGIQYCFVYSVIGKLFIDRAQLLFTPPPGGYPRGKMIRSTDGGTTWNLTDLGDIEFAEWGDPPLFETPYLPPSKNWTPISTSRQNYYTSACFRIATSEPVRLYCHFTDKEPQPVKTWQPQRGTNVLCFDHYDFITLRTFTQLEKNETLYHTFHITGLRKDKPYWLVFTANSLWTITNSISPILSYIHPDAPPFTTIRRPDAPGDRCLIPFEEGEPCPDHYLNIDEATPDEDTTKIYTGGIRTAWWSDLYHIPDLPPTNEAPIDKVRITARLKRTLGYAYGARAEIILKTHGTIYSSDPVGTWPDYWSNYHWHVYTNPATGLPWTPAEINDLQIGVRLGTYRGIGWSTNMHCTQLYCKIYHQCDAYE